MEKPGYGELKANNYLWDIRKYLEEKSIYSFPFR